MKSEEPVVKENVLSIKRIINASRERVFRAWTDPEQLIKWFGPDGFTNTFHEFELKPGGVWRFIMHGPDGTDYNNRVIFDEIIPLGRLVYRHDGDKDNDPGEFHVTIDFKDRNEKTEIEIEMRFMSAEMLDKTEKEFHAIEGLKQHLGRLEEFLKNTE
jgi:uncharacterized protein YndB with AHSA1/START domain